MGGFNLDPLGLHKTFGLPDPIDLHGNKAQAQRDAQAAQLAANKVALDNPAIDTEQTKDKQVTTTPITNTAASLGLQI